MSAAVEQGRLTASRDAPVGGQAVLEGVMMRGVTHVGGRRPQAAGRGPASSATIDVQTFPLESWNRRRRIYRWPVIRGVVALVESLAIGIRALGISANAQLPEEEQEISGGAWIGTVAVAAVFAIGLFFVVPVGVTSLVKHQLGSSVAFWAVEGVLRTAIFLGYLVLLSRVQDLQARVRVPRRRAQGDLLLRGVGRADPGAREALLALPPAVRHELSADRDDHGDLRVRADRVAGVVDPRDHPDRRRAADRGTVVRGHQVGGAQPRRARWVQALMYPGMQLQRLTTAEPDLDQLAVSIARCRRCSRSRRARTSRLRTL